MVRYLSLINFTARGIEDVGESGRRAADFRSAVDKAGGKVVAQYWTVGQYDGCVVFEAPDEKTAASLLLSLGTAGDVRTQSMQAFDESEFASIATQA